MAGVEQTAKVYSADKKLWVGMKTEDAYKNKEVMELFDFADKNNDKVIDESEMRRYNGPLLAVEKDDKTKQRFVGHYAGYRSYGHVEGQVITSKDFEFYPGMKFEEVDDKDFNLAFRDLDTKTDGELSKEEIQKYQDYVERKKQYKETLKYNERVSEDNYGRYIGFSGLGLIGGAIAGFKVAGKINDIANNRIYAKYYSRWNDKIDWDKVPKVLEKLASTKCYWGIALGVTALAAGAGALIANARNEKEKPTEQFKDLKQLDKQYNHVYNS